MGFFGNLLGQGVGALAGGLFGGKGRDVGAGIGGKLGSLLPFKTGGPVKKTGPALIHKGEYILPANGPKPTKAQRAAVAKNKAMEKRKKK